MCCGICVEDEYHLFERLVDACYLVLIASPHENRLPSTGVVLLSDRFDRYRFEGGVRLSVDEQMCWALADGVHSFVAMDRDSVFLLVLTGLTPLDELSLFSLREEILYGKDHDLGPSNPPDRECLLVKRSEGHSIRKVTILAREKIVNVSGLSYVPKPYQYEILRELLNRIIPFPWTRECDQTVKSALRLAIHKLSPENCGATLVILAPNDLSRNGKVNAHGRLVLDNAISPNSFSIVQASHQRPLVHLISQRDGAVIISAEGDVLYVNAFFKTVGSEATPQQGTRHRSAMEFSREIDGMVIVVSSDGPVTVFRKGEPLVSTAN